jgi:hypothetical protein
MPTVWFADAGLNSRTGWAGRIRSVSLDARFRRNLAVALRPGEGPLTIRFADFRHCAVQASGFGELTIYALASRLSASCMEAITASKFR